MHPRRADSRLLLLHRLGGNALGRLLRPRAFLLRYPPLADSADGGDGSFPLPIFRRQINDLHAAGYRFLGIDEFVDALAGRRPGRIVSLCFEGGLRSTVMRAYPVMRALGACGVLFVAPGLVPAEPAPEGAGEAALASWRELRALDPAILRVGNHGRADTDCAALAAEGDIERALWRVGLDIEQQLGYPVRHFACPLGAEGLVDPGKLAAFGYRSVLMPREGYAVRGSGVLALPRLDAEPHRYRFAAKVSGTLAWVDREWGRALALPQAAPMAPAAPERTRAAAAGAGSARETRDEAAREPEQRDQSRG